MNRLARTILVFAGAFAVVIVSALDGQVLCQADAGRHVAIEVAHPGAACPERSHDDDHPADPTDHEQPCNDLKAEVGLVPGRSAADRVGLIDSHLVFAPLFADLDVVTGADRALLATHSSSAAPVYTSSLACLRSVILVI